MNTSSGLHPDAGTFLLFGQEKGTKEKAAPVSRAVRVPCAACLTSAAVELARCAQGRPRAQTVLADIPEVKRAARRDTGAPNTYCAKPAKYS
jgi:hypothetical protein